MSEDPFSSAPAPNGWARPTPVRHDSNFRSWMYFLAGTFLLIALWVPVRAVYQRARYRPAVSGVRDAETFIVLAYGGVSAGQIRGSEEVSRRQFEEHIRMLRQRGFNPIGLDDVRTFYQEGKLLPRKSVMVTLEQSRRNSYLESRDILRANRWKAVMFVRADTMRNQDPDVLRWPILRDMALSGLWDVGAESFDGFQRIPSGPDGETANYFASPRWIEAENRLETVDEYQVRIRDDHLRMVDAFRSGVGSPPMAFAFPYGDYGQYDPRAVATRVLNLAEVERHYGIGFTLGPFLLNTRHSDPRVLNRLQVDPRWSLEQFIEVIESSQTFEPWSLNDPLALSRWRTIWGHVETGPDGALGVRAIRPDEASEGRKPTTGAQSWLVGSDLFEDFTVRLRFRLLAGQFAVRLRARPGGDAGIRLLMDAEGNCRVNQKLYGVEEFLLASVQEPAGQPDTVRELELTLKGRTLFASLDGRMIPREPIDLMGKVGPGLLGLEVWDPEPGKAQVQILSMTFPRPRRILLGWSTDWAGAYPELMSRLYREAYRLEAVSPPWLDVVQSVPLVLPGWDDQALLTFGRIHRVSILPRLKVHSADLALQVPPDLPVREADALGVDGLYVECSRVAQADMPKLVPWLQQVHQRIKEHDMRLAINFPVSVKRMASFASVAALFPGVLFAADSPAQADALEAAIPNPVVAEDLPPPAADMHLNLYYQMATRALPAEMLSPWARQDANRRDGFIAFQEGDYERAIRHWNAWLEEDPQNTEVLSLIGRAYVQKGEPGKGLDYYTRSLAVSPGQIHMAIRRADLLDTMGRVDEAREALNRYARIFPEHPDILIAQAQWLHRRRRRAEARAMLETLVAESPQNLEARVALLNMQDAAGERYQTMRGMLEMGQAPESGLSFGHLMLAQELLTYPESGVFFDIIRQRAGADHDPRLKALYEQFLPLTRRVTDHFATGQLSDGWIASGGIRALDRGRYELRAATDQAETYLRLRRSELMRDGMLEVALDESQGFFWIYARRSARGMVRFGFDQEGSIHLQAWNQGELLAFMNRPWIRPPGSLKLRIELCGDGARGFANDLEIFDAPLEIPQAVAYGWWGIAPFSFELGMARARIVRMDCEPQPAALALVAPGKPEDQVALLRPYVRNLSALAPVWASQDPDGSLPEDLQDQPDILRMFCAFHRIRLMPVLDLAYDGNVEPDRLVDFIHRNHLKGLMVKRRTPASADWLAALRHALEVRPASVIVLETEAALWNSPDTARPARDDRPARPQARDHLLPGPGERIAVREIPVGSVLVHPLKDAWGARLTLPDAGDDGTDDIRVTPRLHLLNESGWVAP